MKPFLAPRKTALQTTHAPFTCLMWRKILRHVYLLLLRQWGDILVSISAHSDNPSYPSGKTPWHFSSSITSSILLDEKDPDSIGRLEWSISIWRRGKEAGIRSKIQNYTPDKWLNA
jgi:hypothetical protein